VSFSIIINFNKIQRIQLTYEAFIVPPLLALPPTLRRHLLQPMGPPKLRRRFNRAILPLRRAPFHPLLPPAWSPRLALLLPPQ